MIEDDECFMFCWWMGTSSALCLLYCLALLRVLTQARPHGEEKYIDYIICPGYFGRLCT